MEFFYLGLVMLCLCIESGQGEHKNFCKPLEDYGPREDRMESRHVCRTEMNKKCEPVTESGCLDVTELRCDILLTTNCTMDWTNKEKLESVMSIKDENLKNCTKQMVREYHNKTIYDCKNVTKVHCTTLWTVDDNGQKVWAGNEDDCRDVTWEECFPVSKQVPMSVAQMTCTDIPISYFDYENITTLVMADTLECQVDKVPVCSPITTTKCNTVTYTRCEEVPETVCTTVEIPVPAQPTLHKQWCLFDQEENIDFDRQVRRITEEAEEQNSQIQSFVGELDPIFTDYSDSDLNKGLDILSKRDEIIEEVDVKPKNEHVEKANEKKEEEEKKKKGEEPKEKKGKKDKDESKKRRGQQTRSSRKSRQ